MVGRGAARLGEVQREGWFLEGGQVVVREEVEMSDDVNFQ